MKKILSITLACLLIFSALPLISVSAEYDPSDDILTDEYNYEVLEDGTAAINRYSGTADEVVVPSEIDGYKVTVIHRYAFADMKNLKSVTLPEGITRIGFCAFSNCISLETLVLPDSLRGIHRLYIKDTKLYKNPDNWIDGVLYVGNHLVDTAEGAVKGTYTVREGTVSICNFSFEDNKDLTQVILPESLHTIADSAFMNCENLEKINLHDNITCIETSAFSGCTSLSEVHIPANIKEIGGYAFRNCAITELTLPYGLETIGYNAFAGCKLTSVTVPESVTYLGDSAFAYCENLAEINLPHSLEHLGDNIVYKTAYANNPDNWENGLLYLDNFLLGSDSSVEGSVYVKAGTTHVATRTFAFLPRLVYVYLPDSVDYIGLQCFGSSEMLRQVRMPQTLSTLGAYAFLNCPALESIIIPEGLEEIPMEAFLCCDNLNYIRIPASVATIDEKSVGYDNPYYDTEVMIEPEDYVKNENLVIAGYKDTAAEEYANAHGFTFKDLSVPKENKYKDRLVSLWNVPLEEPGDGSPYLIEYTELYEYYSEENTSATPDYVLINAYENVVAEATILHRFGDYVLYSSDLKYPGEEFGYHIYIPEKNEVYTLIEAWDNNVEGIEKVFTEADIGELLGDVNYDRKLNIKDATLIQKHLANLENIYIYALEHTFGMAVADYNFDGNLNIRDATAIQKHLAKLDINDPDYQIPQPVYPEKKEGEAQITFDGKTYTANVGDIITINADLYSKEIVSAISIDIRYDGNILNALQSDGQTESDFIALHLPNLQNVQLRYPGFNIYSDGYINARATDGNMDFTVEQSLCRFSFRVEEAGNTNLDFRLQFIYNTKKQALMLNNNPTEGTEISSDRNISITKG